MGFLRDTPNKNMFEEVSDGLVDARKRKAILSVYKIKTFEDALLLLDSVDLSKRMIYSEVLDNNTFGKFVKDIVSYAEDKKVLYSLEVGFEELVYIFGRLHVSIESNKYRVMALNELWTACDKSGLHNWVFDDVVSKCAKLESSNSNVDSIGFEGDKNESKVNRTNKDFVNLLASNDRATSFLINFFYERIPEENKEDDKIESVMNYIK